MPMPCLLGAWAPAGQGGVSRQPPEQRAGAPLTLDSPRGAGPLGRGRGSGCWLCCSRWPLSGAEAVGQPQGAGGDAGHRGRAPEDCPPGAPGHQGEAGRGGAHTHRRRHLLGVTLPSVSLRTFGSLKSSASEFKNHINSLYLKSEETGNRRKDPPGRTLQRRPWGRPGDSGLCSRPSLGHAHTRAHRVRTWYRAHPRPPSLASWCCAPEWGGSCVSLLGCLHRVPRGGLSICASALEA